MGSRNSKQTIKGTSEHNGNASDKTKPARGSSRKKKNNNNKVMSRSFSQNDTIDGDTKTKQNNNKDENSKPVMRTMDDGELGRRPKMGRLSGSFNTGSVRKSNNFSELDTSLPDRGMPPKTAELKVYRSYSSLAEEKRVTMYDGQPSLENVKVYRKTPVTPLNHSQRAMSLPRGFERPKNFLADQSYGKTTGSKELPERGGGAWNDKRMSAPAMRSATLPRLYGNPASSTSSAANYRVSKDDFPATLAIQRRLKQFENMLVRNLVTKFSRLDPDSQLSAIPIAIKLGRPNQLVSLRDYIDNPHGLPDDMVDRAAAGEFILCIAPAMFAGMAHFRRERSANRSDWPTLARDVVTCVAAEAAAEISRMFEYQISLLAGDSSVALLADHGAEQILSFILYDLQTPRLDRNTVIQGVVRGKRGFNPQNPSTPLNPVFVSVIVGMKELKWNLYEIFEKPGLRKDVMLVHETVPAPGDDDRCPWKFYTSHSADPMLYGYRGQLIEWDFALGHFRVNGYDEASFSEEMSWRFDDFHRLYPPFKRLFGARAMRRYYTEHTQTGSRRPLPFDRFLLLAVHGVAYTRDAIQAVYRPLEPFNLAEIEGIDLSSADVPRALLPKRMGGSGVQTPNSPDGEFPVFTPALLDGLRPHSLGVASSLAVPQYVGDRLSGYSPGGYGRNGYSPGNRSPQYASSDDRSPRVSVQYGGSNPQQYTPVQDRSPTVSQSYSPAGAVYQSYSVETNKPVSAQPLYYSPGGTLRKINTSPPVVEAKPAFLEVQVVVPPHYSPGGTLRRGLPANGRVGPASHSSGDMTPRSHSPGGVVVAAVENHGDEVVNGNGAPDPRFAGYTLIEEVQTVHSIKASNV